MNMNAYQQPTPWLSPYFLLPPQKHHLERLCRLVRADAHAVGLLVEALIHAPLSLLVDSACLPPGPDNGLARVMRWDLMPIHMRHPDPVFGLQEFSYAVFTDLSHYREMKMSSGPLSSCFTCTTGLAPLELLAELHRPRPIVIDPGAPHALALVHEHVRLCLRLWHAQASARCPRVSGSAECEVVSDVPQTLLDRIEAFLPQFDAVERAYVLRATFAQAEPTLVLALVCADDEATMLRVGRALPLLGWGLDTRWRPQILLSVSSHPAAVEQRDRFSRPIYRAAPDR